MDTLTRGKEAEDRACRYLLAQGLQLLQRNYHSRRGEIDLVLQDKDSLVFVEVRYRNDPRFGSALESVNQRKQSHPDSSQQPCRFDVISIMGPGGLIEWIPNAFSATE